MLALFYHGSLHHYQGFFASANSQAFISLEPAQADGQRSGYLYCAGDPVNNVDLSGQFSIKGVHATISNIFKLLSLSNWKRKYQRILISKAVSVYNQRVKIDYESVKELYLAYAGNRKISLDEKQAKKFLYSRSRYTKYNVAKGLQEFGKCYFQVARQLVVDGVHFVY